MKNLKKENSYSQFIVILCSPLSDQWECDARRTPCFISNTYKEAIKYTKKSKIKKFEIWGVKEDGCITILEEYKDLW